MVDKHENIKKVKKLFDSSLNEKDKASIKAEAEQNRELHEDVIVEGLIQHHAKEKHEPSAAFRKSIGSELDKLSQEKGESKPALKLVKRRPIVYGALAAAAMVVVVVSAVVFRYQILNVDQLEIVYQVGGVSLNQNSQAGETKLKEADTLNAATQSLAILQFDDRYKITMLPDSSLTVKGFQGSSIPELDVKQSRGPVYYQVLKGQARLRVHTDLAVAAVRGTEFLIRTSSKETRLLVFSGSVEISSDQHKTLVTANQLIAVSKVKTAIKMSVVTAISKRQMKLAKALSQMSWQKNHSENKQMLSESLNESTLLSLFKLVNEKIVEKIPDKVKGKPKKKTISLQELRQRFGGLSKIKTKQGKTYIGGFIVRGAQAEIYHAKGKTVIAQKDIISISKYKE